MGKVDWQKYIISALLLGCGVAGLWVFSQFWLHDRIMVGEPNLIIRTFETLFFVGITIFALYCMIKELLKLKKGVP